MSWREKVRSDAYNADGDVVGQFVLLEDDGSLWQAERSGYYETRNTCSYNRTDFEASGVGSKTLQHAWIYFSLADDDPLQDVLSNGSYFARADPSQLIVGKAHYYSEDCRGGQSNQTRTDKGMGLSFMLSRRLAHPWYNGQTSISAEAFHQSIIQAQALKQAGIRILDTQERIVVDNVMSGNYTSAGAFDEKKSLDWDVEWHITRRLDVKAEFEKPDLNWRP